MPNANVRCDAPAVTAVSQFISLSPPAGVWREKTGKFPGYKSLSAAQLRLAVLLSVAFAECPGAGHIREANWWFEAHDPWALRYCIIPHVPRDIDPTAIHPTPPLFPSKFFGSIPTSPYSEFSRSLPPVFEGGQLWCRTGALKPVPEKPLLSNPRPGRRAGYPLPVTPETRCWALARRPYNHGFRGLFGAVNIL